MGPGQSDLLLKRLLLKRLLLKRLLLKRPRFQWKFVLKSGHFNRKFAVNSLQCSFPPHIHSDSAHLFALHSTYFRP